MLIIKRHQCIPSKHLQLEDTFFPKRRFLEQIMNSMGITTYTQIENRRNDAFQPFLGVLHSNISLIAIRSRCSQQTQNCCSWEA